MQTTTLQEIFEKHQDNFRFYQVCQLLTTDNILYEFFYDDTEKCAVLDIIEDRDDVAKLKRTTYKFDKSNITITEAFELLGYSVNLTFDINPFLVDEHPAVYISLPISGIGLGQGTITLSSLHRS